MKSLRLYIFLLLTVSFFSCGDDEPLPLLSGKIDNIDFTAGDAVYEMEEDNMISFDIYSNSVASTDPCFLIPNDVRIFFNAENTMDKQDLFIDFSNFEGFTVTLFNPNGFVNIIATEGYFQIIEKTGNTITAELEAKSDNESTVKGQFTATLCE